MVTSQKTTVFYVRIISFKRDLTLKSIHQNLLEAHIWTHRGKRVVKNYNK